MSRRKQQRPRLVKALVQTDDYKLTDASEAVGDDANAPGIILQKTFAIGLHPYIVDGDVNGDVDGDVNGDDDDKPSNTFIHGNVGNMKFKCSTDAVPCSSPYVLQTSTSTFSVPPSASLVMSINEIARCERFANNVSENQEDISHFDNKIDKCLLCSSQIQNGANIKPPVEGKDYFIDCDGTLAIRNGICPRSLAFSLFSEVLIHRSKYTKLLGKNMFKFLLNLKQIVAKQRKTCPGENPSDLINAENVLNNFSFMEKELYDLTNGGEGFELIDTLKIEEVSRSETMEKDVSSNIPDKSVNGPSHQLSLLNDITSHKERNVGSILSELPTSVHDHIYNSEETGNIKSDASDNGSTESFSRVTSPSSSVSSVNSVPSLSDRAKEMTSTKRGCKILPVASTDGHTHYLCPVCNLELSSDHELTIHIRSHNQSGQQSTPNTCTICGKTLSSQSSLDRHMLVHSGERPFKCKICDMSFTTNGNMHRHARIHEKNGITPKSTSRKPIQHKPLSKEDIPFHEDKSNSGSIVQLHQPVSVTSESDSDKTDLPNNHQCQEQNTFLQPYYRLLFPYNAAHHPAFPYPQLMHYPTRMNLPFLQTMLHPMTGESLAHYVNSLSRLVREPSPDLRVQQKLHCTVCKTVFSNQFALESHMETHVLVDEKLEAESGSACKSCKTVAKSEASLLLHSLKHHMAKSESVEADIKSDQKCVPSSHLTATALSNCSTNNNNIHGNAMGFQNLGFANFTTKKFPLIAKAFCENYPSTRAVRLPVYKCKDCDLEFPVEGAKHLHEASHVPEEYTMCPKCNCHFSEPSRLQEHMQKHVSDLKFEESSEQKYLEHERCMLQYHFLAQFGLTPKEVIDQTLEKNDFENVDICVEERSVSSYDDNNKVLPSDDDDISELSQATNINEHCKEQKTDCYKMLIPMNMLLPTTISDTMTCSNSSLLMPSFEASQKLPEDNEGFLPSSLKCSSNSAKSDPIFNMHHSALKVSNVSVPPELHCKYCNITVTSPRALKYHLYTHKKTSQFQCKMCSYSSADKNTLLRHMRVHSGERPYKCVICEYSFTTKANCERHLRQKHGLEKNQLSDKLVFNKHILTSKNKQSPGSTSNRQSSQSQASGVDLLGWRHQPPHDNTSSEDRMDYSCQKCMRTFTSRSSILQHISTHHPHIRQYKMGRLISSKNDVTLTDMKLTFPTPPHAHLKSSMPPTFAIKCSSLDTMIVKQELNFHGSVENSISDHFPTPLDMLLNKEDGDKMVEEYSEKPIDFSTQQKHSQREDGQLVSKPDSLIEENLDILPIDLSVQKMLNISAVVKAQDQDYNNQRYPDVLSAAAQKQDIKSALFQSLHNCDSSFVADVDAEDCTHKNTVVSAKSPTESDSSCEFASVNKILDVTDAQNFHNYLHIPEIEDEQEIYISESASSDEDSSINSGHMYSHLKILPSKYHTNTSPAAISVWKKRANGSDIKFTDSSSMNEQAIAELIEKVSQENDISPIKKKKNSYADSPHKFACPFCPRCFPWLSSLNRHLLTHTGQKPFKCPRCPVIFSTKSNRERHLIRKHNVNMLDPASRSTMDRPYKCHICMFSSFSTHNNLMKHYKDKHSDAAAPSRGVGGDKQLYDGGWEDVLLNGGSTSYEDEEEYNSMVEMQGGISDMEVMYENYAQDSDSNHSSSNSAFFHDAQMKNNNVLNLKSNEIHKSTNKHINNISDINMPFVKRDTSVCTDDSIKCTIEESSKLINTPTTECQKQHSPNSADVDELSVDLICDQALSSNKLLARCQKSHNNDLQFQCSFCDYCFVTRLECLQHFEQIHQESWALIKEKNDIGNVQVFSTRLDKMIDKLYKKEREICEINSDRCNNEEQNCNLQKKSISTNSSKSSMNNYRLNKSATGTSVLLEKDEDANFDIKTDKQKLHTNGCVNSGFEVIATDYLPDEVSCALCPERLKSLQDLKTHMNSHIDVTKMYPDQVQPSGKSKVMCLSTLASNHKVGRRNGTDKSCEGANGSHTDMLHDLLGVESSTIDQIFESSDSAASLLGVYV